jgi:hypothetical protein
MSNEELDFAAKLAAAFSNLPALLDWHKTVADHTAEYDRLNADKERLVASYKVQALADAKEQAAAIVEQGRAEARKLLADAQGRVDAINDEVRAKVKLRDAVVGDVERGEARLAEYHRVRQALAS